MVELITNGTVDEPFELRHCPKCNMATTLVHFVVLRKDEAGDVHEDDYRRCLMCLTLFTLELEEAK